MGRVMTLVALGSALALGCADAQTTAVDANGWGEDLDALAQWVAVEVSFSEERRRIANARIEELRAEEAPDSEAARWVRVASVVGLADNGHSNLSTGPVYGLGLLPIRTYWFSDGLYVVRARTDHANLIGARVDSIGGVAVDDLVTRLGAYHGGTDGYFRQYFSEPLMLSPAVLHADGASDDPSGVRVSVRRADGFQASVELARDASPQTPRRVSPWVRLLPDAIGGENGTWAAALDAGAPMPLALQEPEQAFRYVRLEGGDVVYLQLRANIDRGGVSIRDWANEARDRLEDDRPKAIILDNRFNGGGDLTRTAELALDLPTLVPPEGAVYVLTSNATFSAGIYTSFYPESTDAERTIIVGEHVGDRTRFYAESRGPFVLPSSGYRIGHSLQMHDVGEGCPVRELCHLAGRGRMDIAVGDLEPDVPVAYTYDDFEAGRDPVLEWALADARGR